MSVTFVRVSCFAQLLVLSLCAGAAAQPAGALDPLLLQRATLLTGQSRVVVTARDAASLASLTFIIPQLGGTIRRSLPVISGCAAILPNTSINALAGNAAVQHIALDRVVAGALERTGAATGASAVRSEFGLDGSGIGIAVIDSGITAWHDDLADVSSAAPSQRVDRFFDFVGGSTTPSDDYGHGTHVAGIIAGNGFDSDGARSGIAPAARLVVLKVLDGSGTGRISDVIAALDYAVAHQAELNIRIINLSVATGVYESYNSDPLTVAARRAVDSGIVVVASAGNNGRDQQGNTQYGGITAPGNAPWVLTVGASSHMGTIDRSDDTIAAFSSRGPTAIDRAAKPDLVAPGVGIESLSSPNSTLSNSHAPYLLAGTRPTPCPPYLSLSGTSQAAPVVTGTVALMLQTNPALTPNAVKALLQFTSQIYDGYDALTQGAGFLNAEGAVELASFLATSSTSEYPSDATWSRQLLWGNHRVLGGRLTANTNAWQVGTLWGTTGTAGQPIVWGVTCWNNCAEPSQWGVSCADPACTSANWSGSEDVVWGSWCDGSDCQRGTPWNSSGAGANAGPGTSTAWSTSDGDTIVWGTSDGDTIVWGTSCTDPSCDVVWPKQ